MELRHPLRGRQNKPYPFVGVIVLRFTASVNRYFPIASFRGIITMVEENRRGHALRFIGHSIFISRWHGCRCAFRHLCVESPLSTSTAPLSIADRIRSVATACVYCRRRLARVRHGLPAVEIWGIPDARYWCFSVLIPPSSPSVPTRLPLKRLWQLCCLLGIAIAKPPFASRTRTRRRRDTLLRRGPGDNGLHGSIPVPRRHTFLESLVNYRPIRSFISFVRRIRSAFN